MQLKSKDVLDYFKFKGRITAHSFADILKSTPGAGFIAFHAGQQPVINAYEERVEPGEEAKALGLDFEYKYNTYVVACGRRWGKSWVSSILGAMELMVPNARVMIVSFALSNCETIFDHICKILNSLGVELVVNRRKDMELQLINGSTLICASVENVESRLGKSISLLLLDEARLFKKELLSQILKPMLLDYAPLSKTVLISSPSPGWFQEAYNQGQSLDPKYSKIWSVNSPTHMNETISREYLKELEETMPRSLYEQEVLGLFTSKEGAVFPEFDPEANTYLDEEYPQIRQWLDGGNTTFQTIDSGYNHFFSSQWILYVEELDTYFVFQEYFQNKTLTPTHASNIKAIEADWNVDVSVRYADPAAAQQIYDFQAYDLYYTKSDKNTRETINNLNTLFFQKSEITGKPKLLISKEHCPETIRQLIEVQWKEDAAFQSREQAATGVKPFRPDTSNLKTDWDAIDSLRYGMYSFHKSGRIDIGTLLMGGEEEIEDPFCYEMSKGGYFKVS